ncbi:MAG: 3'(2'),5'-bisphosphate nucleotidase CysQ [Alphaproteobacteria bacterium]|nr:3'(2'),5'-bisphosphate nucleotidase CysQ [Alphaproteobacteria bacterium]
MTALPPIDGNFPSETLLLLSEIAIEAGRVIEAIYASDFAVGHKSDESPVTEADLAAEKIILERLKQFDPSIPIVSEEAASAGHVPDHGIGRFWLVDPLDGTKEFVRRSGEFTVNIGLIEGGTPVLGVVLAPVPKLLYAGGREGAWKKDGDGGWAPIAGRLPPPEGLSVVASRSHGDPERIASYLAGRKIAEMVKAGSSLKICRIAEGSADVYPRFGPTSEWDTAAAHAVLLGAGGHLITLDGKELVYGKSSVRNPDFVAWGLGL